MPIQLTAQGGDFRANVQALNAAQARQSLQKIQAHLSQPGKGTGTLTLFNRTKAGADLTLERKSRLQLLGRGERLNDTKDTLLTLLDRAGLSEAKAELAQHLGTRNRVGAAAMLAILDRHIFNHRPVRGASLEKLLDNAFVERGALLGQGGFGAVHQVKVAGEPMVLKTFLGEKQAGLPLSNQRKATTNEAIAAYLTSRKNHPGFEVNVIQPKYFIVRATGRDEHRLVDPLELRTLLKQKPKVAWECAGLLMPAAKGGEVTDLYRRSRLTPENKRQIIQGTLETVMKLNARGFIHRDLKPDNIFFDHASGQTTLIDTGMLHKSTKRDPASASVSESGGTPAFMHPRILGGTQHGSEVDLYATAITALVLEHGQAGVDLASKMEEIANARDTEDNLVELLALAVGTGGRDPKSNPFATIRPSLKDPKSLTSFAVACLEQAGRPAEEWADRATAQGIYAQLLQHPSLQKA